MTEPIDWDQLQQETQSRRDAGLPALSVLELIIGEDRIREAVDYYVAYAYRDSTDLVSSFLRRFQPLSATQRCYEIYKTSHDIETRRTALSLLSDIKDGRTLEWVEEFLTDPHPIMQAGGINLLDQLLFGGGIREYEEAMEKAKALLDFAMKHENLVIRERAAYLQENEARREAHEAQYDAYMAGLREASQEPCPEGHGY